MRYSGSYAVLLALHLIGVVVLIGPLGYVTSTAGRLAREGDVPGLTRAATTVRAYSFASLLVVVFGTLLLDRDPTRLARKGAWVQASYTLWLVATVVNLALVVPTLKKAAAGDGKAFAGKLGMLGGISALCWVAIAVLMVYKPGA